MCLRTRALALVFFFSAKKKFGVVLFDKGERVKKAIGITLCGLFSCIGVAAAEGVVATQSDHGTYLGVMLGGAHQVGWSILSRDAWRNTNWGWALGGDMGYRFTDVMSAEFGGYWTQKINSVLPTTWWHQHWLGYLAIKMQRPITSRWNVFGKFGVGVNHWSYKVAGESLVDDNGYGPVFALGSDIHIIPNLSVELQYMRFAQSWNTIDRWDMPASAMDLLTVGLTYHLRM